MKITKGFEFESAHRLSDYEGKCKRVHGHNYKGIVTIEGASLDSRGILVDFSDVKKVVKELIVEKFDHRLILKDTNENRVLFASLDPDWIVWVDYNPTAENMAIDFAQKISEQIPFASVELFETPDSSANSK